MTILEPQKADLSCDGKDHGVPPERVNALSNDAYNFNQVLKANQSDGTGKGNFQVAMAAGQAFYDELIQLPIGERKALLQFAEAYNKEAKVGDPAMPTIEKAINANGFLENLTIEYPEPFYPDATGKHSHHAGEKAKNFSPEKFVYQGSPMCAEY